MAQNYKQWSLRKIIPGERIPAPLYLHLEGRYVQYRGKGQIIDRTTFDRMEIKNFQHFFILESDEQEFEIWSTQFQIEAAQAMISAHEGPGEGIRARRQEAQRKIADIFHSFHAEESISQVLETSTQLVDELTKQPFTSKPLAELQTLSRGTADHSVNVSVLSVYLAVNMGYSHMIILKHLAAGALLHDIGKIEALRVEESNVAEYEKKLHEHPTLGEAMVSKMENVSREVKMIVAQHHEFHDGTGYPNALHGNQIYDLARIVAIANVFDGLVSEGKGPLAERQRNALTQLDGPMAHQFNPMKLKKIVKILSLGI
jgi:putative nucleotidyltransferase with HDIG domain